MPYGNAQTLSNDDVYAIVAYILYSNFLVDDDFVLSNENLARSRSRACNWSLGKSLA